MQIIQTLVEKIEIIEITNKIEQIIEFINTPALFTFGIFSPHLHTSPEKHFSPQFLQTIKSILQSYIILIISLRIINVNKNQIAL